MQKTSQKLENYFNKSVFCWFILYDYDYVDDDDDDDDDGNKFMEYSGKRSQNYLFYSLEN